MEIRACLDKKNRLLYAYMFENSMEMPESYVWQLKAQHYHIWSLLNDLSTRLNIAC